MSSFLFLLGYLVHIIWMDIEMGCEWSYSCGLVGFCLKDLFHIARRIFVRFPS